MGDVEPEWAKIRIFLWGLPWHEDGASLREISSLSTRGRLRNHSSCKFSATLIPVNPAFNAYHADPAIDCLLIVIGGEANPDQVEMFMSVMDAPDAPGMSNRAIIFAMLPLDEMKSAWARSMS